MSEKDIKVDLKKKSPQMKSQLTAVAKHKEKGITAIRQKDSEGKNIDTDFTDKGTKFSAKASGQYGETGVRETCHTLIEKMNEEGSSWGKPKDISTLGGRFEKGIDCIALDTNDKNRKLQLQVTRANVEQGFWKELSQDGEVLSRANYEKCSDEIFNAIIKKARSIPISLRQDITMALDASIAHYLSHIAVKSQFQRTYSSKIHKLGFKEIWVVGPTKDLTFRIDQIVE